MMVDSEPRPPFAKIETVDIRNLLPMIKERMPGVNMLGKGVIGIQLMLNIQYNAIPANHAVEYTVELIEQLKLRAIRDLGLQPMLTAIERDIAEYRQANAMLKQRIRHANETINRLEDQIAILNGEAEHD